MHLSSAARNRFTRTLKSGKPAQCFLYRSATFLGPTKGLGTQATSLKQSEVIPSRRSFISCELSALTCSRSTSSRRFGIRIWLVPRPCLPDWRRKYAISRSPVPNAFNAKLVGRTRGYGHPLEDFWLILQNY